MESTNLLIGNFRPTMQAHSERKERLGAIVTRFLDKDWTQSQFREVEIKYPKSDHPDRSILVGFEILFEDLCQSSLNEVHIHIPQYDADSLTRPYKEVLHHLGGHLLFRVKHAAWRGQGGSRMLLRKNFEEFFAINALAKEDALSDATMPTRKTAQLDHGGLVYPTKQFLEFMCVVDHIISQYAT